MQFINDGKFALQGSVTTAPQELDHFDVGSQPDKLRPEEIHVVAAPELYNAIAPAIAYTPAFRAGASFRRHVAVAADDRPLHAPLEPHLAGLALLPVELASVDRIHVGHDDAEPPQRPHHQPDAHSHQSHREDPQEAEEHQRQAEAAAARAPTQHGDPPVGRRQR